MGLFKKIADKINDTQKEVIKDIQEKIEGSKEHVLDVTNKIIENTKKQAENILKDAEEKADEIVTSAYLQQKEVLDNYKSKLEQEYKNRYNYAIGETFDKILSILHNGNFIMKMIYYVLKYFRGKIIEGLYL